MHELTPRQTSVLTFIENFVHKYQQPPTEREIAEHFRIHQSAVRKHLTALENKGSLTLRRDGRSRGIRLNALTPAISVPIVGGISLPAIENVHGSMMLDARLVGSEKVFLFRMAGDSMKEAGIEENDLLLVRRIGAVRNGEVVVATIDGELAVKRYFNIAGRIVLESANRSYRPIAVEDPANFQLEGRVVALIRTMDSYLFADTTL